MVKRRKGPPARPSAARHESDKAGVISAVPPAEAIAEGQADHGPESLPEVHATPDHAPSVHETLLETVSPEAIEAGTGEPVSAHDEALEPIAEPAEPAAEASAPEAADLEDASAEVSAAHEADPAVTEQPAAVEAVADAASQQDAAPAEQTATSENSALPQDVASLEDIAPPAPLEAAVAPQAAATVEAVTALAAVPETAARSGRISIDLMGEFAEANATFLSFLRNEGSAALAHWQTLSAAKTPADALRIQVDEMQRAADASLTCFAALARRAGRMASGIGRV